MDPAYLLLAALVVCVETTVLLFVRAVWKKSKQLELNAQRLEREFIPQQIDRVIERVGPEEIKAFLTEKVVPAFSEMAKDYVQQAIPIAIDGAQDKLRAYFEGVAGKVAQTADGRWGKEAMDELASIDFGHPFVNGMWATAVRTNGPVVVRKLGRVARKLTEKVGAHAGLGDLLADEDNGSAVSQDYLFR